MGGRFAVVGHFVDLVVAISELLVVPGEPAVAVVVYLGLEGLGVAEFEPC